MHTALTKRKNTPFLLITRFLERKREVFTQIFSREKHQSYNNSTAQMTMAIPSDRTSVCQHSAASEDVCPVCSDGRTAQSGVLEVALFLLQKLEQTRILHGYKLMHLKCIQAGWGDSGLSAEEKEGSKPLECRNPGPDTLKTYECVWRETSSWLWDKPWYIFYAYTSTPN